MPPADAYLIRTSPRSGSTLLRGLLAATSLAAGGGGGPVFGLRLQRRSAPCLFAQIDRLHPSAGADADRLSAAFGRAAPVHLTRRDKTAQAASFVTARESGLRHAAPDGTEIERPTPPAPPAYDPARLRARMQAFQTADAERRAWFTAKGLRPPALDDDALSADPQGALHQGSSAHWPLHRDRRRGLRRRPASHRPPRRRDHPRLARPPRRRTPAPMTERHGAPVGALPGDPSSARRQTRPGAGPASADAPHPTASIPSVRPARPGAESSAP